MSQSIGDTVGCSGNHELWITCLLKKNFRPQFLCGKIIMYVEGADGLESIEILTWTFTERNC